jgi:hypothetical protein
MYRITVAYPFISDYLRSDTFNPLVFSSIHEALEFLKSKNCTIDDCLQFYFDIEVVNE